MGANEIFYFRNGQKELHFHGGRREVACPDGTCYAMHNGSESFLPLNEVPDALMQAVPSLYLG